jgi:HEAT repeat protein
LPTLFSNRKIMVTFYCPNCWAELRGNEETCPECGYKLENFETLSYEEKLIEALHHPVAQRRNMAAQVLGNLNSQRALQEFAKIMDEETEDYYLNRAILLAAAKIEYPERKQILMKGLKHSSPMIAKLAQELIDLIESDRKLTTWDKFAG